MAIELQNAPAGNLRVVGGHRQGGKQADAALTGNVTGFATLMSFVSDSEPESDAVAVSAYLAVMPASFDGKPVSSDANGPLDQGLLADVGFQALAGSLQTLGTGMTQVGNIAVPNVAGSGIFLSVLPHSKVQTQPGIVKATSNDSSLVTLGSEASAEPLLQSIGVDSRLGLSQMVDVSPPATANAQIPGGQTQKQAAVAAAIDLADASIALAPVSSQLAPTSVIIQVPVSAGLGTAQAVNPMVNLEASAGSTPGVRPLSRSVSGQRSELTLNPAPIASAVTTSKTEPVVLQATLQILGSGQDDENLPAVALKAGGIWAWQQGSPTGLVNPDASQMVSRFAVGTAAGSSTLPGQILALAPQDAGVRALERPTKHPVNRFGSGGDGVYGQPLVNANPSDAMFQVVPASAAVASTVVAETVSYWASQGIHSASLQLEGFGDEPVEVRISVNGDMTQVDFRTNQPEVRQVLEGAASQLKDLLTSQGMQLAGMSIGTSGRNGAQEKGAKQAQESRKVTLLKSEVLEAPRLRGANPSVGQSLDLFV
jgi:hypothetical protein